MLLSDLGADVIRIDLKAPAGRLADRHHLALAPAGGAGPESPVRHRGPPGCSERRRVFEGFRRGVMSGWAWARLGAEGAPQLSFADYRLGSHTVPYANAAGHDLNVHRHHRALHTIAPTKKSLIRSADLVVFSSAGLSTILAFGCWPSYPRTRDGGPGDHCAMIETSGGPL